MRTLLAIWLGKLIIFLTRSLKIGGGSAAPGLYALKIAPNLISTLIPQIPQNVIVTGTNGKTTTSRLIAHFVKESNLKAIRNATGSNLERGIASALLSKTSIFGKIQNVDLGIWELDEAAFNSVAPKIKPQIIVFLNVFRDQLDRYGEVDSVLHKWRQTLLKLPTETLLLLNGDDHNIYSLQDAFEGETEFFSFPKHQIKGERENHKKALAAQFTIIDAKINGLESTAFTLKFYSETITGHFPLPGIYNLYDFVAAFAVGYHLNLDTQKMVESLHSFSPAFGRVEKVDIAGKTAYICLIKNPTGATQVFETIAADLKPEDHLLLALNDNFADGLDVSWIWDAQFEKLIDHPAAAQMSLRGSGGSRRRGNLTRKGVPQDESLGVPQIFCSGTRAQDLATRLKYAGVAHSMLLVENSLNKALFGALEGILPHSKGRLFIFPTYTALLELQRILAKMGAKEHYWVEK